MTASTELDQVALRCVFMRGGSSRGLFFLDQDLPSDPVVRDQVVLAAFGSPDVRQIDGLGGGDPLTSKVAVISRSRRSDADVDYTFGQVSVTSAQIFWKGNCGNISSAVGPFAIDEGLVPVQEPTTLVRIHNTNTGKLIEAEVPVRLGRAVTEGDTVIAGVPGGGAPIALNFLGSEGAVTGRLLPTGSPTDKLMTSEGEFEASIVDAATPFVFVDARSLGCSGTESAAEIDAKPQLLVRLEAIRSAAAQAIGLVSEGQVASEVSPSIPRVAMVTRPVQHQLDGELVRAEDVSIVVRQMSMQRTHKAFAVTGSVCLGAAMVVPGTIPNQLAQRTGEIARIAHPQGVIEVDISIDLNVSPPRLTRAVLIRTARRLMDGHVYVKRKAFSGLGPAATSNSSLSPDNNPADA
jgi:2-methylaconitate cis-trans-isomerase PrpF